MLQSDWMIQKWATRRRLDDPKMGHCKYIDGPDVNHCKCINRHKTMRGNFYVSSLLCVLVFALKCLQCESTQAKCCKIFR